MIIKRRDFLRRLGVAALAGTQLGPGSLSALAGDASGYRALVCLFLFGGMDNHDFLIPYDAANYRDFARIRQTLLREQGASRARESLLPLLPDNAAGGPRWALAPEMPETRQLFDRGEVAIVANVGPLIEPTDRQRFLDRGVRLPPRLFSHNDQQATWQASAPEGAQYGWGGLFADALVSESAGSEALAFCAISSTEVGPFLTGRRARPYQVSTEGASQIYLLGEFDEDDSGLGERLRAHLRGENYGGDHLIRRDVAGAFAEAIDTNARYNQARASAAPLTSAFPATQLGAQLRAVAETIAVRNSLGVSRQLFFVGMGGFDTHSAQATTLPRLLSGIDSGLAAFNAAMQELGVAQQVTLFTASDFGRTLAVNGDGTDHGWGGHQLVMGGAVRGRRLLGSAPPPVFDHDLDAGGGRLIPGLSVEQFAAPLGRWFGLNDEELAAALPALGNFDDAGLELMG